MFSSFSATPVAYNQLPVKWAVLLTFFLAFAFSFSAHAQYVVDFDGAAEYTPGTGYGPHTITLNGIDWDLTQALIPQTPLANDWQNGTRSARMRGYSSSVMEMAADKSGGVGTISFDYRRYGSDAQVAWQVEYSTDGGVGWTSVGSPFTATATVQTFSETINQTGNVRIRIIHSSGGAANNRRMNIDDITLTDYAGGGNTITTGAISGSPFCVTGTGGSGAAVSVPFTSTGTFNPGNVYTAELSDATGSFAAPMVIGTLASTANNGTISATIPAGTATGSGYRIRVVSDDPATTGSNNGVNLNVVSGPADVTAVLVTAGNGSATIQWTNPTLSCFDQVIIIATEDAPVEAAVAKSNFDGVLQDSDFSAANTNWAARNNSNDVYDISGNTIGSDNTNYAVYRGTGTTATITGLTNGTSYHFRVFVESGSGAAARWSDGVNTWATPNEPTILITHSTGDAPDAFEFVTLRRLDISSYKFTDNAVCQNGLFRINEIDLGAVFNTFTDVPAGTYFRVIETGTTNTDMTDGLVTVANSAWNGAAVGGDQVIVYTGTTNGALGCGGSGSNTYIAGLNWANGGWINSGTPNANTSYRPNTPADFQAPNARNVHYNGTITGNATAITSNVLNSSNWGTSATNIPFDVKDILFNQPAYSSGSLAFSGVSGTGMTIDWTGATWTGTNSDTRYMVVIHTAAPSVPANRYTCYTPTGNFATSSTVVTSFTTPPCTGASFGSGRIVYLGYDQTATVSGLNPSTNYQVRVYALNGNGYSAHLSSGSVSGNQTTNAAATPTITVTGSLSNFGWVVPANVSAEQTYTVSGTDLSGNITINAPAGYEISLTSGGGFTNVLNLVPAGGSVAATTIYVRFAPMSDNLYNSNITHTSPGAVSQNQAVSGFSTYPIVINEFVADHVGTDNFEYIEVFGQPNHNYSNLTLLEIEGDAGAGIGVIDRVISVGTTDANGFWWTGYLSNQLENGSKTYLLVYNFTGSAGQDLDTNDDGILDITPWTYLLDDVGVKDISSDITYSTSTLLPNYDGLLSTVGGASRIPNGLDTDQPSDWVRNDFDGAGIASMVGTPSSKEAINTPGTFNALFCLWTGNLGTNWFDAGNWDCGTIPSSTDYAVVPDVSAGSGNYPNVPFFGGVPATALSLTIEAGANIAITASNKLEIYGHLSNFGAAYIGPGPVEYRGTIPQYFFGVANFETLDLNNAAGLEVRPSSTANIIGSVLLRNGVLSKAGSGNIILKSDPTKTAFVNDFSAGYTGTIGSDITVERLVQNPSFGFHYIASPVAGTIADWAADFNLNYYIYPLPADGSQVIPYPTCDPGQVDPTSPYGRLFDYRENQVTTCQQEGWHVRTTGNALAGQGFAAILDNNTLIDQTGAVNTGTYNFSLTRSAGNTSGSAGFNLMGNPYPSNLDWGAVAGFSGNSNIDGTAHLFETNGFYTGTYQPANQIVTGNIASSQAFFVEALVNNANLTFNQSMRSAGSADFKSQAPVYDYLLEIQVAGAGVADRSFIAFGENFTEQKDRGLDALKMPSGYGYPTLFTVGAMDKMSVQALPQLTSDRSIEVGFEPGTDGAFTFSFLNLETLPGTALIHLEDRKTGNMTDLRLVTEYAFTSSTTDAPNRFVLHFVAPLSYVTQEGSCSGQDGRLLIYQSGSAVWNYVLFNDNGIAVANGLTRPGEVNISGLSAGFYTLSLTNPLGYGTSEDFEIVVPASVAAGFIAQGQNYFENQAIRFENHSAQATQWFWNMGDGTVYNNVFEPEHIYNLAGTFVITLEATNGECTDVYSTELTILPRLTSGIMSSDGSQPAIFSNGNTLFVDLRSLTGNFSFTLINALGQVVFEKEMAGGQLHLEVLQIPSAVYFGNLQNREIRINAKVFLGESK